MGSPAQQTGPMPVEAIERALALLDALAQAGPAGIALARLCRDLELNKSTAYRALATMRARGYVVQDANSTYRLGPAAIALGASLLAPESLAQQLHPALVVLARELGELVHLGTLHGDRVLYIDKVEPDKAIRVWSQVGREVPAATTSLGRAILAYGATPMAQLDAFATSPADLARLRKAVARAQRLGYATETEENEPGIACLGVPILRQGQAIAALSITMLAGDFGPARVRRLLDQIRTLLPPRLPDQLALPPQLESAEPTNAHRHARSAGP